jgi:hypothetical protein
VRSIAVIAISLAACSGDQRIPLQGSDLIVEAPRGFVENSSVYASWPHLEFVWPPDREGLFSAVPTITVEELSARTPAVSLGDLKIRHRAVPKNDWIVPPHTSEVAGISAYVYAYQYDAGCPHGGCGPNDHGPRLTAHGYVFAHAGHLYSCELVSHVQSYELVRPRFEGVCESIRFASHEIA